MISDGLQHAPGLYLLRQAGPHGTKVLRPPSRKAFLRISHVQGELVVVVDGGKGQVRVQEVAWLCGCAVLITG